MVLIHAGSMPSGNGLPFFSIAPVVMIISLHYYFFMTPPRAKRPPRTKSPAGCWMLALYSDV